MIPRAHITSWRANAPWPSNENVEQDLVLSRALVEIFQNETVSEQALFRGGTALHKLIFKNAGRYSEDIDLVQRVAGQIGPMIKAIRETLDPWLGNPKRNQGQGRFTLLYRYETAFEPISTRRMKIEINTREHFSVLGTTAVPFTVENSWFSGFANIPVFQLDELLGTKLRALFQRKKGRDLFDLWFALNSGRPDVDRVLECFGQYMLHESSCISRAEFEANMAGKMTSPEFLNDHHALMPLDAHYSPSAAWEIVKTHLIEKLPGDPWKGQV
ncbi:MAG: nucleotidyl transferase AbiEii/AbiGii toxin family protein [Deltaproteobacteria bacterium HGW-Deltaproteobacteria-17]|nr:MAG: nucleotidyl transferase AbiEii/AbiGii toxin family protein [Deltaproteobacteria bacterium HGW-Deltaproteobacteria-17]